MSPLPCELYATAFRAFRGKRTFWKRSSRSEGEGRSHLTPSLRAALTLTCLLFLSLPRTNLAEQPSTPIANAAEQRDWDTVQKLLASNTRLSPQSDGMTALHWAVHQHHLPTVEALLNAENANVDAKTEYGITPLSIACEVGHPEIVARLLDAGADPKQRLAGKVTPLHLAARSGNSRVIESLIKHGAEPDEKEQRGQTPLMWAAAAGHANVVTALLDAEADVEQDVKTDFTAMMFAARQGHMPVVKILLDAGVDANAVMHPESKPKRVPRDGTSALTLAVESGHFELAMFLIEAGADPNDQRNGFAPLHQLSWVRRPAWGEEPDGDPPPRGSGNLNSLDFVRALVGAGADVNLRLEAGKGGKAKLNRKGATPFLLAARTADLPLMKLLVELGAAPTTTNADGCTPLMAAAGIGVRSVGEDPGSEEEVLAALAFLVEHGNDVDTVDDNKETAMHGAGYRCYPRVVEFLAEHGAKPDTWNHKNESGWTPLMIAKGYRPGSFKPHPETVAAIEKIMEQTP